MTGVLLVVGGLVLFAVALVPQYGRLNRRRVRRRTVSRVRARLTDWLGPDSAAPLEPSTTDAGGRHRAAEPTPRISRVRRVGVRSTSPTDSTPTARHHRLAS